MKRAYVMVVFAACAVIGFSINAAAADLASDEIGFGEYLDSQTGTCDEVVTHWNGVESSATEAAACYVTTNCPNGAPPVSCSGNVSCATGSACGGLPYVVCDGQKYYCSRGWCGTQVCCSDIFCSRWCSGHGYDPVGYCIQGCCDCA